MKAKPGIAALPMKAGPDQSSQMDDYDIKSHAAMLDKAHRAKNPMVDVATLVAANKIKADKPRHAKAKAAAAAHRAHLDSVAKEPTIKGPPKGMSSAAGTETDMQD